MLSQLLLPGLLLLRCGVNRWGLLHFSIEIASGLGQLCGFGCQAVQIEQVFFELGQLVEAIVESGQFVLGVGQQLFGLLKEINFLAERSGDCLLQLVARGFQVDTGHLARLVDEIGVQRMLGKPGGQLFQSCGEGLLIVGERWDVFVA